MKKFKFLLVFLTVVILFSSFSTVNVNAKSVPSQADAVAWAKSKVGYYLDFDGQYGAQCVDLIYFYYVYLCDYNIGGDACDFIENPVPSGWTKISTNISPQPGDIAVFKVNYSGITEEDGHVAIVTSVSNSNFTAIDQNPLKNSPCEYNTYSNDVLACVIRPNFGRNSFPVAYSIDYSRYKIESTNAVLSVKGYLPKFDNTKVTYVGIVLWDYQGTKLGAKSEDYNIGTGIHEIIMYYDINKELNVTLKPGTTYTYQMFALANGNMAYTQIYQFKTTGTHTHEYDNGTVTTQPSCSTEGVKTYTCSTCGNLKTESIEKTSHSYGAWQTTKQATCTSTGTRKRTCSCGDTQTQTIAKTSHNYSTSWTVDKEATCTETGSKSHHCTNCSAKTDITTIPKAAHSYGAWQTTKQATCTSTGTKKRSCSCGDTQTETIAKTSHNYSTSWTVDKEATCIEEGSKSHHCLGCDEKTQITVIPKTEHNWSDWVTTQEPTVDLDGIEARECKNEGCLESESRAIPKLPEEGHVHHFGAWYEEIKGTCTTDGLLARVCECSTKQTETVTAKGHIFGEWKEILTPTETAEGKSERICSACGKKEYLIVDKLPQNSAPSQDVIPDSDSEQITKNDENNNNQMIYYALGATALIIVIGFGIMIIIVKKKKI